MRSRWPTGTRISTPAPGVLIIDQFEELYAPGVEADRRACFIDRLLSTECSVIIAIREDFYSQIIDHPRLAKALQDNQIIVGPMTIAELREAITGPVIRAGMKIEDGLVELLLIESDRRGPAGILPLLSHALLATWRHSDRMVLTVDDYRATGGIRSAIARTAEEALAGLRADREVAVRTLFLRLVTVVEGVADTRHRVARSELPVEARGDVLDQFVLRRLVVVDAGTVEIAHEALLTAWPRLRGWIEADRHGQEVRRQLTEAATAWRDAGADPDLLLRGARLATASELLRHSERAALNDLERRFLVASEQRQLEHDAAQRRAEPPLASAGGGAGGAASGRGRTGGAHHPAERCGRDRAGRRRLPTACGAG